MHVIYQFFLFFYFDKFYPAVCKLSNTSLSFDKQEIKGRKKDKVVQEVETPWPINILFLKCTELLLVIECNLSVEFVIQFEGIPIVLRLYSALYVVKIIAKKSSRNEILILFQSLVKMGSFCRLVKIEKKNVFSTGNYVRENHMQCYQCKYSIRHMSNFIID